MEKLIANKEVYDRIFIKDENTLVKYSVVEIPVWQELCNKNISFINTPIKTEELSEKEKNKYKGYNSKIYLPFFKGYLSLYEETYTNKLDTEEILKLFINNMKLIQKIHEEDVYHSDLNNMNILINENLDIKFIDFEALIVNNNISIENVYQEENIEAAKTLSIIDDKLDVLYDYIWYLLFGNFKIDKSKYLSLSHLKMPFSIKEEIRYYIEGKQLPKKDYYFEDIINELLKEGYEAPKIRTRKNNPV